MTDVQLTQPQRQRLTELKLERVAAWCGPIGSLIFFLAFWPLAQLMPVVAPSSSAAEVAAFWDEHTLQVRLGIFFMLFSVVVLTPFFCVLAVRVARAEGRWGVLAVMEILGATALWLAFVFPLFWAATAALRLERDPEITQALVDMFWLPFIGAGQITIVQLIVLGVAGFIDQGTPRTFPRWYGYYCMWYVIMVVPTTALYFFKTGPLAYNGLLTFWLAGILYVIWVIVTPYVLLKAINEEKRSLLGTTSGQRIAAMASAEL